MRVYFYPVLVLAFLTFSFCSKSLSEKKKENPAEPFERFAEQRAYPDAVFDLKAFETLLEEEHSKISNQKQFSALTWVLEGPTNIGGRITCLAVSPTNSNVVYAGTPGAGVYKTTNGGQTWQPIFDTQSSLYIGAISIDPNNSNIIYVGTGDPSIPFTVFVGDGLYKSNDAGLTWTNIGLSSSKIINKILINPNNSSEIYVSANGNPILADNNRGVYKSSNGGLNWSQVLFIDNQTGVSDMVMNPNNPNEIYATSMTCIRNATVNIRYSNNTRVYKTTNGGSTWSVMNNGLPNTKINRYSICMSKQNPSKLYVAVSDSNFSMEGVYVSTNAGGSFSPLGNSGISSNYSNFGWYFGELEVNPSDDNEIYIGGIELHKSGDGGNNWNPNMPPWWQYDVHADIHAIAFVSPGVYYLGTDGGVYFTNDDGANYIDADNIPNTQFYRVEYNPHQAATHYGGAQDNGTTSGNQAGLHNWQRIFGGDGFQPRFDPGDPNILYVETQNGGLMVSTDGGFNFNNHDNNIDFNDRRNWDMPYVLNKQNADVQYTGTYRVYKTSGGPMSIWNPISADLTDGIIYGERFHTISAIDNSDLNAQKIYVGTSDGNVWTSANDGNTWNNITSGLPDRYVTSVHASPNVSNNVYVTLTGYKYNSYIPHIHKSTNNGLTWTDISGDLPQAGINDVLIFPNDENLLFVATDIGVYYTTTGGQAWLRLGNNMPLITVWDLVYNPSLKKLIAGTYAKSIQSIDISSLITGVNENDMNSAEELTVYPNPIQSGWLHIKSSRGETPMRLELFTIEGKKLEVKTKTESDVIYIQSDNLPEGLYILQLDYGNYKVVKKFTKL